MSGPRSPAHPAVGGIQTRRSAGRHRTRQVCGAWCCLAERRVLAHGQVRILPSGPGARGGVQLRSQDSPRWGALGKECPSSPRSGRVRACGVIWGHTAQCRSVVQCALHLTPKEGEDSGWELSRLGFLTATGAWQLCLHVFQVRLISSGWEGGAGSKRPGPRAGAPKATASRRGDWLLFFFLPEIQLEGGQQRAGIKGSALHVA